MANKKGPLRNALDSIKKFLGIKPKESTLDRIANAAAVPKTQGKVINSDAAQVYKPIKIQNAKEIQAMGNQVLSLYGQGKGLLLKIIAAKNDDFAKEIHNRAKLEQSYFKFIQSAKRLIKEANQNQSVPILQKLGHTKMLDNNQQEIYLPMVKDLEDIINKISMEMEELRNKKADQISRIEESQPRKLSTNTTDSFVLSPNTSIPEVMLPEYPSTASENIQTNNVKDIFTYNFTDRKTLEQTINYYLTNRIPSPFSYGQSVNENYRNIAMKISELKDVQNLTSIQEVNKKIMEISDFIKFCDNLKVEPITMNEDFKQQLKIVSLAIAAKLGVENFGKHREEILKTGYLLLPKKKDNHP